jgi:hypothetical protein
MVSPEQLLHHHKVVALRETVAVPHLDGKEAQLVRAKMSVVRDRG